MALPENVAVAANDPTPDTTSWPMASHDDTAAKEPAPLTPIAPEPLNVAAARASLCDDSPPALRAITYAPVPR